MKKRAFWRRYCKRVRCRQKKGREQKRFVTRRRWGHDSIPGNLESNTLLVLPRHHLAYLVMLIIALNTSARHQHRLESHRLSWFKDAPMTPPITIIAPAHNEEASIRVAIRNLLELDYPELEVIVVNDGSEDRTL